MSKLKNLLLGASHAAFGIKTGPYFCSACKATTLHTFPKSKDKNFASAICGTCGHITAHQTQPLRPATVTDIDKRLRIASEQLLSKLDEVEANHNQTKSWKT